MSTPLWQCADYLKYVDHSSPLVREWALDGLEYHFPSVSKIGRNPHLPLPGDRPAVIDRLTLRLQIAF